MLRVSPDVWHVTGTWSRYVALSSRYVLSLQVASSLSYISARACKIAAYPRFICKKL